MNIFLTGATGYIGHSLAVELTRRGDTVHALVRDITKAKRQLPHEIKLFQGDITDINQVRLAMAGCTQVYHLAAYARLWSAKRQKFFEINVDGTRNVLDASVEHNIEKLVYTSSCGVLGNSLKHPLSEKDSRINSITNDYDFTKHMCECMIREYSAKGLHCVIVNPSRVYGPGQEGFSNPFSTMISRCLEGKVIVVPGPGHIVANYAYIDDVVQGHIAAMRFGKSGERYILGGANLSYKDVIRNIRSQIPQSRIISVQPSILKALGWWNIMKYRLSGKEPQLTPNVVKRITKNAALDCSRAVSELQYSITPFDSGIQMTIRHNQHSL
jgi:nucleoside-diphosphate-sugar epimerase